MVSGDAREMRRLRRAAGLVIAAHPDDEVLWAGSTLASGGWAAAVLTHRSTRERVARLRGSAAALGANVAVFDLPDRRDQPPSADDLAQLTSLVARLVRLPGFERVMTHGPDGEYGHPYHRLVSTVVTSSIPAELPLWYFSFRETPDPVGPEAALRKHHALRAYFDAKGALPGWDAEHVILSGFEHPVPAGEFVHSRSLVDSVYGRTQATELRAS